MIEGILRALRLPADDVEALLPDAFVARRGGDVVGVVALERAGEQAVVRGLAVLPGARHDGVGTRLLARVLAHARELGAREAWLLTEHAERFFARRGFERAARDGAPAPVRASRAFASLCPEAAACMRREILPG